MEFALRFSDHVGLKELLPRRRLDPLHVGRYTFVKTLPEQELPDVVHRRTFTHAPDEHFKVVARFYRGRRANYNRLGYIGAAELATTD